MVSSADISKGIAFNEYRRARSVLSYNLGFRRPGQEFFIRYGREKCAALEAEFPDFNSAFTRIYGSKYAER
jgi:hypothetical protein